MNTNNRKEEQSKRRKSPSLLDAVLERRMLLYVLAAGATLAGASSAQAQVIYTPSDGVLSLGNSHLAIDLNNDGTTDFSLVDECFSQTSCFGGVTMYAKGYGQNAVEQSPTGRDEEAAALSPGVEIGSQATFKQVGRMLAGDSYFGGRTSSYGPFAHARFRFLGVRFLIHGQTHYGWIGFRSVDNFTAKLLGYAYEARPNRPLRAGQGVPRPNMVNSAEPTSLELLAAGHVAVAEWRGRGPAVQPISSAL
jgi:hypothetical protein